MAKPPSNDAPEWMKPAGIVSVLVAGLAFLASATVGGGPSLEGAIVAGALNPLFFVGLPLGLYWLKRSGFVSYDSPSVSAELPIRQPIQTVPPPVVDPPVEAIPSNVLRRDSRVGALIAVAIAAGLGGLIVGAIIIVGAMLMLPATEDSRRPFPPAVVKPQITSNIPEFNNRYERNPPELWEEFYEAKRIVQEFYPIPRSAAFPDRDFQTVQLKSGSRTRFVESYFVYLDAEAQPVLRSWRVYWKGQWTDQGRFSIYVQERGEFQRFIVGGNVEAFAKEYKRTHPIVVRNHIDVALGDIESQIRSSATVFSAERLNQLEQRRVELKRLRQEIAGSLPIPSEDS